jgi:hypothetical protein
LFCEPLDDELLDELDELLDELEELLEELDELLDELELLLEELELLLDELEDEELTLLPPQPAKRTAQTVRVSGVAIIPFTDCFFIRHLLYSLNPHSGSSTAATII